jgi:hypothetical protein
MLQYDAEDRHFSGTVRPSFDMNLDHPVTLLTCIGEVSGTQGNGLGKLYATGYEGLTVGVWLIMFGKLGTSSKERIPGSIPL